MQAAEALGLALAEFGGPAACEEAVQALRKAVELQPHLGHEKHMYLGQLVAGQEGIGHLRRGVELLQAESDRRCVLGCVPMCLCSCRTTQLTQCCGILQTK